MAQFLFARCNSTKIAEEEKKVFIINSNSTPQPTINNGVFSNPDALGKRQHKWNEYFKVLSMSSGSWPDQVTYPAIKPNWSKKPHPNSVEIWWLGHSCFLIRTEKYNLITDPNWDIRAGPWGLLGPKRLYDPIIDLKDLPSLDFILISHNHYDHLSVSTLKQLYQKQKDKPAIILTGHGVDKNIGNYYPQQYIVTTSYWDSYYPVDELTKIFFVRAQHWSRRTIRDSNKALWGGFVIDIENKGSIYFAGDTGYSQEMFHNLARGAWSPLQAALLPIGAYKPEWFMGYSHLSPADAVKAFCDLGFDHPNRKAIAIAMHYKTYHLSKDGFDQPENDLKIALDKINNKHNFLLLDPGKHHLIKI